MFLENWMLVVIGLWWLGSTYHISRNARIQGVTIGINYTLDILDYEGNEKIEAINKIRKFLNEE